MSRIFEQLQKAKQVSAEAAALRAPTPPARPTPAAPVPEEDPYIEVGGPEAIEASADVLACPPPARKLFLHSPTPPADPPAEPPIIKMKPAPATISFCTWNG